MALINIWQHFVLLSYVVKFINCIGSTGLQWKTWLPKNFIQSIFRLLSLIENDIIFYKFVIEEKLWQFVMDDSLLSRAFDVEDISEDFDPTVPPSTGHEYLQHVMYEASKCAQVVVADIDKRKLKNNVSINLELCDRVKGSALAPSIEWQHTQVAIFSDLRKKVELAKKSGKFQLVPLPKSQNEEKWFNLCFGEQNQHLEPSLSVLLSMSDSLLECLLEYQLEWLEEDLKPNQGRWIYALLACLSLPLTSASCSVLRDLARKCLEIRCSKSSMEECDVNALNLFICLVGKYFGQVDLPD